MVRARSIFPPIAIAPAVALLASPAFARSNEEVHAAAAAALAHLDLQRTLPGAAPEPFTLPFHFEIPPEFFWLALALGIVVIAWQFRDMIPIWRRQRSRGWAAQTVLAGAAGSAVPNAAARAADELARQGDYAEAMHVLLLHSIAQIRERLDEPFADSLTSREILRSTRLAEAGKAPLRDIVHYVERTHFGRYPAGRGDYEACRARFDSLDQALRAGAAA